MVVLVVAAMEWRERRRKKSKAAAEPSTAPDSAPDTAPVSTASPTQRPEGCCGEHLVCEKETLLNPTAEIVYYDDEELDALAGIQPEDYTEAQYRAIKDVFSTLREEDVTGWCRSLQLRNIALPQDIREEALLIVRELRNK